MISYKLKIVKLNLHKIKNLNKINNNIPKNIFQTWYTQDLPPKMKENVELLKQQNPELEHYLFDDEECLQFIKDNFDKNVSDAYNALIPGAYKAHLWRYCILYKYGGIYLDIKYHCVNDFKLINLTNKEYYVKDRPEKCIYNALLAILPNNETMLKCINQIVENVQNNYYGDNPLSPTGPLLLGSFLNNDYIQNLNLKFKRFENENKEYILLNDEIVLKNYEEYRDEQSKSQINKHYGELWWNKNIYLKKINRIIPLNIYTTWHTKNLPSNMKDSVETLKNQNPEFNLLLFDQTDCIKFIQENFNSDVVTAYNSLIPCSYKSDLWRFCVLYINGGIYVDIKYQCVDDFKLINLTDKEYFVNDRPDKCIYTALIITLPKNEIMLKCINQIVDNVKNNYYGVCTLEPTGPRLLGKFFTTEQERSLNLKFERFENENKEHILLDGKIILKNYEKYREEQSKYQKNRHYGELWWEKKYTIKIYIQKNYI